MKPSLPHTTPGHALPPQTACHSLPRIQPTQLSPSLPRRCAALPPLDLRRSAPVLPPSSGVAAVTSSCAGLAAVTKASCMDSVVVMSSWGGGAWSCPHRQRRLMGWWISAILSLLRDDDPSLSSEHGDASLSSDWLWRCRSSHHRVDPASEGYECCRSGHNRVDLATGGCGGAAR